MQITEIITDESMRELTQHGSAGFPFEYYYDDVKKYVNQYIDWHWHREFEWCFVENGSIICMADSARTELEKGDGIFINSRVIHRFESAEGAQMPNILFLPEFIAPESSDIYSKYILPVLDSGCGYFVVRHGDEKLRSLHDALVDAIYTAAAKAPDKLDIMIKTARLWQEFFPHISEESSRRESIGDTLTRARLRCMIQFITENYRERITLTDIAHSANISKSEALRCFNACIGTTPVKYLIGFRLEKARLLLLSTNDTITQISIDSGIDNISYFIRIFTKTYGTTPKKYRSRFRGN